jgi:ribonucleoside-triphosphate reductase
MLTYVTKKDGKRRKKFDVSHIYDAIKAAFGDSKEKISEEELDELVGKVVDTISANNAKSVQAGKIQKTIEDVLMDAGYKDTVREYIEFRTERDRERLNQTEIIKTIKEISESTPGLKSSNILRDNANEAGSTPAGTYGKIASETNKVYNLLNKVNKKFAREHKEGYLHIHDLNFYNLTFNCLFAPVGGLLRTGFDSGTGFIRPAKSIQTAASLAAVIFQLQSNQQYGGIACDNFDFDLAPFVDMSFRTNLAVELNRYAEYSEDRAYKDYAGCPADPDVIKNIVKLLDDVSMNTPEHLLYLRFKPSLVKNAIAVTDNQTHQAMEALVHNLNSLQSRSGNQVPFSSLNFGLDTSNCGRMVSRNLMRAQYEGMGDGLTPIFPILIFKLMRGYTKDEGDPNYDLYLQAIDCLARRFYPNFVKVDSSFNLPYVKYETKELEVTKEAKLKLRGAGSTFILSELTQNGKAVAPYAYEYDAGVGDYWEVVEVSGTKLKLRKLIPNTTISTMGCRTRVIGNINGPEQTTARGNFAFHTINLPRLAIEAHIEAKDTEKRKELFFSKLDGMLQDARDSLLDRFNLLCSTRTYENYPFTMQQGLYLTANDTEHDIHDSIAEVMKQSTLSIGYIGIAEVVSLITGKTYGVDHDVDEFALSIVKRIREYCDKTQKETHLNWSCFATPAEAVAGRFANIDKNKFTVVTTENAAGRILKPVKGLEDVDLVRLFGKGYYTNSHMMDFSLDTTLENKIATEAPFHKITNAGHIFYYKLNGDLTKNTAAVKAAIDAMYDGDLGYFTVTMDSDDCLECGFHGIINNECPKCGCKNEDKFARVRRITGYLTGAPRKSIVRSWNDGKLAELGDRNNI